jgi:hypothetical protein
MYSVYDRVLPAAADANVKELMAGPSHYRERLVSTEQAKYSTLSVVSQFLKFFVILLKLLLNLVRSKMLFELMSEDDAYRVVF